MSEFDGDINYPGNEAYWEQQNAKNAKKSVLDAVSTGYVMLEDMARTYHFTIQIDKIPVNYHSVYSDFLPVYSVNFTETNFETMPIPVGVLGNFPIMYKRTMGQLGLVIYDNQRDEIEKCIRGWENECFPQGKYVNYLSNIVGTLRYRSFDTQGKCHLDIQFYVIPNDSCSINRSYEQNALKTINLNLTIIGVKGMKNVFGQDVLGISGISNRAAKDIHVSMKTEPSYADKPKVAPAQFITVGNTQPKTGEYTGSQIIRDTIRETTGG